jgi:hypothetical protein
MAEFPGVEVRQYVGKRVHVGFADGRTLDGHLLSFDGRTLWLVSGGEDTFVPVSEVVRLRPAPAWTLPVPH